MVCQVLLRNIVFELHIFVTTTIRHSSRYERNDDENEEQHPRVQQKPPEYASDTVADDIHQRSDK